MGDSELSDDPREQALSRIKHKRRFQQQLVVYVLINVFLWAIWAIGGVDEFPWPIFVTLGWGIGIAVQAWQVYGGAGRPITEAEIEREMKRGMDPS
jgi:2TM domain